ncbi:TadE-like protein [Actinomadura pelletieri DSM 43383]|uniref:Pilus assembly protein n=2 Tax=Actinomadura TaxID=1988 RepID=A0A372G7V1_9ACTN|nr:MULTISPECIES: TadE/TadG family type IV pilus assembly protein [Actinomadura]RFS81468.1 pilus assembly protein [Actinomadura spongiicola]RKS78611.1 TadE-like protein [Actinomadura pelletieri DSM 43383]
MREHPAPRPRHTISTSSGYGDRGSVTLELVVFAPALIVMLLFVIAAGRITQAHQAVEAAARDAARQASIARDPATAQTIATSSAQAALTREGMNCPAHVSVDTSGFARPLGTAATVTAHVTCTVQLADVSLAGVPTTTVKSHFTSPIDPYRGRQP